ncbi:hypothetical protein GCM10027053_53810 [Intrasporangium mesophilum]
MTDNEDRSSAMSSTLRGGLLIPVLLLFGRPTPAGEAASAAGAGSTGGEASAMPQTPWRASIWPELIACMNAA